MAAAAAVQGVLQVAILQHLRQPAVVALAVVVVVVVPLTRAVLAVTGVTEEMAAVVVVLDHRLVLVPPLELLAVGALVQ